ncbi:MAG TPA: hypothetical protein VGG68_08880 [Caulobacteraceae bacterium]
MPRRSYLTRIAEPRTPGLPTLFAAPRAAAEDARPPAILPVSVDKPSSRARAVGDAVLADHPSSETLAHPPDDPITVTPRALSQSSGPSVHASAPSPVGPERPAVASAGIVRRATPAAKAVAKAAPKAAPSDPRPDHRAESWKPDAVMAWIGPERPWDPPTRETTAADPFQSAPPPPTESPDSFQPNPALGAEPSPSPMPIKAAEPSGPQIHIGHVEVRTTPASPAAAPPAPAAPAAPRQALSHGYAWRFGPAEA